MKQREIDVLRNMKNAAQDRFEKGLPVDGIWITTIPKLLDHIDRLLAERDTAKKCINDIETYLELGYAKFIKITIDKWRGVKVKESVDNENV